MADAACYVSRSLHDIASPAVAVRPEWALRAHQRFRIVDPLLTWTGDDAVRHDDRLDSVNRHKLENLACNHGIAPNVVIFGEPTFQGDRFGALRHAGEGSW